MKAKANGRKQLRQKAVASAVAAAFTATGVDAIAAVINWNTGSGLWNVAGNWVPSNVPGAGDEVVINISGLLTVTHNAGLNTSIQRLAIGNAQNTLRIDGGSTLSLTQSGGSNAGTIALGGAGGAGTINFGGGGTFANSGGNIAIDNGGTVNVNSKTISGGTITSNAGGTLLLNNGSGLAGLALAGPGAIRTANGSTTGVSDITLSAGSTWNLGNNTLSNASGTITNNGSIVGGAVNNVSDFRLVGDLTLAGGGSLTLQHANDRIYDDGGGRMLTNAAGHTIQGFGQLGLAGSMRFTNNGLVDANVSGETLRLNVAGTGGTVNNATLRASGGGVLQIERLVDNTNGLILAQGTGSRVALINGSNVVGGTLTSSNGGQIRTTDGNTATVRDVALSAGSTWNLGNNTLNNASGTITNNGRIVGGAINNVSDLRLAGGDLTLAGTGSLTLQHANDRIHDDGGGRMLTNAAGHTIQGFGQLGLAGSMRFTNNGLVDANVNGETLRLNVAGTGGTVNNATLRASGGGVLQIERLVDNTNGLILAQGTGSRVALINGSKVVGGTLTSSDGGQIRTSDGNTATVRDVTLSAGSTWNLGNNTLNNVSGTITNNGRIVGGATNVASDLRLIGGNLTLAGTGSVTLQNANDRIYDDNGNRTLTNAAGHTIQGFGQLGIGGTMSLANAGTVNANQNGNTLFVRTAGNTVANTGVLRAENGGILDIDRATTTVQGAGLVEALANSTVRFTGSAAVQNNAGGELIGGIWRANSVGGSSATITLRGSPVHTNSADVYLVGAGSVIRTTSDNSTYQSLDNTLHTNQGALRLQQGRSFNATANGGNFTNAAGGLLEVSGSTFTSNTLVNNGTIVGFGNSSVTTAAGNRVTGNGTVDAVNGTLTVTRRVDLGTGSNVISRSGATVNLSDATQASRTATLTNGGSLNLGAQNIVVTSDYTNASFGTGNGFDRRANVSGAGQIIGQNALQTVTGNVTAAGENAFTLDLGNVRGGTSRTVNYQIANNGTGADIRGATQTAANGGNITDARLSGSGVTAQNFGPIAAGAASGNQSVTFNATSGGSLAGQRIAVVSNFDNVATQIINLQGNASALAQGNATPSPGPVNLGNFHVGSASGTQAFNVANTTSGAGAERLGIGSVSTTGNFSATNNLGAGFINGGASQANAVGVSVNGGTAGVNTGSLALQYTTNGTQIDPSFTTQNANTQNIALTATGYRLAEAGTIAPINFGNVLVGSSQTRTVTISNIATADGFSEALNAAFGTIGGVDASRFSTNGAINGLLAGQTDNATMTVTLNTNSAGAVTGNVQILLASNGDAIGNGLGVTNLPTQVIDLGGVITGTVGNLASAGLAPTSVNFGKFREGMVTSQTQQLNVSNLTVGPGEGLSASFGANTGTAGNNGGSIASLATGASNNSAMSVTLNGLGTAGAKTGTTTVNFQSDGTFNNGTPTALPSQTVTMNAEVYRLAQAALPADVALAARRVGDTAATANVVLANAAAADGYSEGLRGTFGAAPAGFTLAGPAGTALIAAGGSESRALSLSTGTAGSFTGTVNVAAVSNGAGTSGYGDLALGNSSVQVSGKVHAPAVAQLNTATLNFGTVRVGDVVNGLNVSVTNAAAATALNDTMRAQFGTVSGPFSSIGGPVSGLGAGQSNAAGSLQVGLDTSTAGSFNGSALMLFSSQNPDMDDLDLNSQLVTLIGQVNNLANGDWDLLSGLGTLTQIGTEYTLDLGDVLLGSTLSSLLQFDNDVAGPADLLRGSFNLGGLLDFSYSSEWTPLIGGLAAGDAVGGLQIGFNAASLGLFENLLTFSGFSYNDSDLDGIALERTLRIRANVIDQSGTVPEPGTLALLLAAAVAGWLMRRQRELAH